MRVPSPQRVRRVLCVALVALCAAPAAASAATTFHVETTGTDSVTCGATASPCLTVAQAVTNAASGDSVAIGAGTFDFTNRIAIAAKSLDIGGAGQGVTILDGQDSQSFTQGGMFRYSSASTQSVHDLTFAHVGRQGASGRRYSIFASASPAGAAINLEVYNVTISGSGSLDTGIYSFRNGGTLNIHNDTATNFGGNAFLLEQHTGPATVANNTVTNVTGDCAMFAMTYNQAGAYPGAVTGAYNIHDNTFNSACGLAVYAGFPGLGDASYSGGFTVASNTVNSTAGITSAISFTNPSTATDGGNADITGLVVSGNVLNGAGAGTGVAMTGRFTSPSIVHNNIRGYVRGVLLAPATAGHAATGATVNRNQLVDNTTSGLDNSTPSPVDATENWWGCNAGASNTGCDAVNAVGKTTTAPNEVIAIRASPAAVTRFGTTTVTADLGHDSVGAAQAVFDDGLPVTFVPTGGTVSPSPSPSPVPLASGLAATTFTSTGLTGRSVAVTVDHQTVTVVFTDVISFPLSIDSLNHDSAGNLTAGIHDGDTPTASCFFTYSHNGAPPTTLPGVVDSSGDCGGAAVPGGFALGTWTITVTATDQDGNTASGSDSFTISDPASGGGEPDKPPAAATVTPVVPTAATPVAVNANSTLLACAGSSIAITDISRRSGQVRILGVTTAANAGKEIHVAFEKATNVVAKVVAAADGSFRATAPLPSSSITNTNSARYRATIGTSVTPWLKYTRRLTIAGLHIREGGDLVASGKLTKPLVKGAKVNVTMRSDCGAAPVTIAHLVVDSDGEFSRVVTLPDNVTGIVVRLTAQVASPGGGASSTYSIARPIQVPAS